jgi:putative RNA 2'-phosphotransferase
MSPDQATRASKVLSLVLRHEPAAAHVTFDSAGWTDVAALLEGCAMAGRSLTPADLEHVVKTNTKNRFEFSPDGLRIRAAQAHSFEVELEYAPSIPPPILYHGNATRFLGSISEKKDC